MAQKCEYAQKICDRLDSRSQQQQQIELMACELGGNCSGFPTQQQAIEATAIILSSQQIVCREKYEQFKQETLEESVQKNKQMIKEQQQQIIDIIKESRK